MHIASYMMLHELTTLWLQNHRFDLLEGCSSSGHRGGGTFSPRVESWKSLSDTGFLSMMVFSRYL